MSSPALNPYRPDRPRRKRPIYTVRDVIRLYLEAHRQLFSSRAFGEREKILWKFAESYGDFRVAECVAADLEDWIVAHPDWQADWTRRNRAAIVKRPFNWAAKSGRIRRNPFSSVTYREGESRPAMTDEWYRRLLGHTDPLFRRLIVFLRVTGCRPGEATALEWAHVNWERRYAALEQHKTRSKTRKPRVIPLVPTAIKLLAWLQRHPGKIQPGHETHVFLNQRGTRWNRSNLSLRMQRLRRRAGVPAECKLHSARHAFGTAGVKGGANLKLLSQAMGHRSVATLERYYVHVEREIDAMIAEMEKAK